MVRASLATDYPDYADLFGAPEEHDVYSRLRRVELRSVRSAMLSLR